MSTSRIALVTGASRGLGWATARELNQLGYGVVLAVRDPAKLDIKQSLFAHPDRVWPRHLEAADPASLEEFCASILQEFKIDVLVNNAGVFNDGNESPLHTTRERLTDTLSVNTLAPIRLMQACLPGMVERNFGRVVNVSSGMGQLSEMGASHLSYRLSKTALNAATGVFSGLAAGRDVLVNSVCPGWVKTDMGGSGAPRDIAQGIRGIVWAATLPKDGPSGGFFRDGKAINW